MLPLHLLSFFLLLRSGGTFSVLPTTRRPSPRLFMSSTAGPKPSPTPASSALLKPRSVRSLERPTRLPVWPAWNGVVFILLDVLGQRDFAAKLEDWLGGRVCPMMLDAREADPFILLVHHRHSFQRFDPLRAVFRLLLAEGFPAHPHRGFETVTYVLPGRRGLVHRDSLGFKMRYSDGDAQWMTAGRGMLHEEMWETDANEDADDADGGSGGSSGIAGVSNMGLSSDAELYQLWLNLPPAAKMVDPKIQLVRPFAKGDAVEAAVAKAAAHSSGESSNTPQQQQQQQLGGGSPARLSVVGLPSGEPSPGVTARLLSGEANGLESDTQTYSPVTIVHATLTDEGAGKGAVRWELPLPSTYTCLVYVRQGSVDVVSAAASSSSSSSLSSSRKRLRTHELAYLDKGAGADGLPFDGLCLELPREGDDDEEGGGPYQGGGCDVMVFAGEPLRAPVASSGTMVMNSNEEVEQAFVDYQRGDFGIPWEHEISDEEWTAKVQAAAAARMGRR